MDESGLTGVIPGVSGPIVERWTPTGAGSVTVSVCTSASDSLAVAMDRTARRAEEMKERGREQCDPETEIARPGAAQFVLLST
jgi:hypothetical protein